MQTLSPARKPHGVKSLGLIFSSFFSDSLQQSLADMNTHTGPDPAVGALPLAGT